MACRWLTRRYRMQLYRLWGGEIFGPMQLEKFQDNNTEEEA
jgi:hypothetical protein